METGFFAKPHFQQAVAKVTGILGLLLLVVFPVSIVLATIGLIMSSSVKYSAGVILNAIVLVLAVMIMMTLAMLMSPD